MDVLYGLVWGFYAGGGKEIASVWNDCVAPRGKSPITETNQEVGTHREEPEG